MRTCAHVYMRTCAHAYAKVTVRNPKIVEDLQAEVAHSYGPYSYGIYRHGLYSYGLRSHGLTGAAQRALLLGWIDDATHIVRHF